MSFRVERCKRDLDWHEPRRFCIFLSRGTYPIFDSRVRRAFRRLTGDKAYDRVDWYLGSYLPFFSQLISECRTDDKKAVDNALFMYGRKRPYFTNVP